MKRTCDICGLEADEYWMFSYNAGTRTVWLCWDCWKNSQREATLSDLYRGRKLHRIYVSKKRKK